MNSGQDLNTPVIAFDIKDFSKERIPSKKIRKREILKDAIEHTLQDIEHDINSFFYQIAIPDTGDGLFGPVRISSFPLIFSFMLKLNNLLVEENSRYPNDLRIKVRAVIHFGSWQETVQFNRIQKTPIGPGIDDTARLLDAQPLKKFVDLNLDKMDLVFGVSDIIHSQLTDSEVSLSDISFHKVLVIVKQFSGSLYLCTNNELALPPEEKTEDQNSSSILFFHNSIQHINGNNLSEISNELKNPVVWQFPMFDKGSLDTVGWDYYKEENEHFYNKLFTMSRDTNISSVYIYPLSPIPLLIHFGYLLQDNFHNLIISQYDNSSGGWVTDTDKDRSVISMKTAKVKKKKSNSIVVAIEVSASIKKRDVSEVVNLS